VKKKKKSAIRCYRRVDECIRDDDDVWCRDPHGCCATHDGGLPTCGKSERPGPVCVCGGCALATTGGGAAAADSLFFSPCGRWWMCVFLGDRGERKREKGGGNEQTGTPDQGNTRGPASTRGWAHAHLCVVALLGGWLLLSPSGGRRESGSPPTFVSVRSVVTDLSTCVAYVSGHLKHTCVYITISVPFYKTTLLRVFELTGLVTMGRSMAIYWPFNGHFPHAAGCLFFAAGYPGRLRIEYSRGSVSPAITAFRHFPPFASIC